jgi:hypothetical protein
VEARNTLTQQSTCRKARCSSERTFRAPFAPTYRGWAENKKENHY